MSLSSPPARNPREAVEGGSEVVEDRVEDYDYGRFGWVSDPEGNRIALWQLR
jgi:predicted enzyme related to lactoylglutathione lyase